MALDFEITETDTIFYTLSPEPTLPITMSCWVNVDSPDQESVFMSLNDDDSFDLIYIGTSGDNTTLIANHFDLSNGLDVIGTREVGVWHHIGGIFRSDSNREGVLDGVLTGSADTTSQDTLTFNRLAIGGSGQSNPCCEFNGQIAECGVWDVALTAAEMASLGAGYSPLFIRPASLILYVSCVNTTSRDRVGVFPLQAFGSALNFPHPPIIYPRSSSAVTPFAAAVDVTDITAIAGMTHIVSRPRMVVY